MTPGRADLLLLLTSAVYGTAYVAQREAVTSVPPGLLAFARLAIASLILLPFLRGTPEALSALTFASYSLIGRDVLRRWDSRTVTSRSILWGALSMVPVVAAEWAAGVRPAFTPVGTALMLYLAVVVTALAYLAWNAALARVTAPRAAIFINVQPVVGVALGIWLLGEPVTIYTLIGLRGTLNSCPSPVGISS